MPVTCAVVGCHNRAHRDKVSFFRFPNDRRSKDLSEITTKRKRAWIKAIKRSDLKDSSLKYLRICSDHFITGAPAKAEDNLHPDWIPNQKLSFPAQKLCLRKIRQPIQETEDLDAPAPPDPLDITGATFANELEMERLKKELEEKDMLIVKYQEELTITSTSYEERLKEKDRIIEQLQVKKDLSFQNFKTNDKKVLYFTGLPNGTVLEQVFNIVRHDLTDVLSKGINEFDVFIMVLMKLRLDLPFRYLAYKYNISTITLSKVFHENIKILNYQIGPLVRWPERNALKVNTPRFLNKALGHKFTAIIGFFEVLIENPGSEMARSQVFSPHAKCSTIKYLIAMSPGGAIIFLSKGYGGGCSDKIMIEGCGLLDNVEEGDIIICGRGVLVNKVIIENGAKVLIAMEQMNVEGYKAIPSLGRVRIHVDRMIGILKKKFLILKKRQPITAVSKQVGGEMYFDYIVRTCCALVNACPVAATGVSLNEQF